MWQNSQKTTDLVTFTEEILKVACRVRVAYLKEWNHQFFTVFPNKFLKHVFNIILKLNNHPWKSIKLFLEEKNDAQISGFAVVKKAPSPWKKNFLKKKFFQLICTDKIYKTVCGNFLKINGSRDI